MSVFSDIQRPVVVQATTELADGVVALDLVPTNGRPLPPWTPGSHIDLLLGGGLERQYSLCGDPADRAVYRVAVLLEPSGRGGSAAVHALAVGDTLRLRGPRNHFAFDATDRVVLVAGGIGITPMLSMIDAAQAAGADWTLHYAGRSRSTMAFVDDLVAEHPSRVRVYAADEGERLSVDGLADGVAGQVFCCGPRRLIDAVDEAVGSVPGWTAHAERFEAREFGPPMWSDPFEVELALSGTTLTVEPGQSILQAVEDSGAVVVSSCRVGTCGSCETPVLEGTVEHRDSVIGPGGSGTTMMICVSRAACASLVLEL